MREDSIPIKSSFIILTPFLESLKSDIMITTITRPPARNIRNTKLSITKGLSLV